MFEVREKEKERVKFIYRGLAKKKKEKEKNEVITKENIQWSTDITNTHKRSAIYDSGTVVDG